MPHEWTTATVRPDTLDRMHDRKNRDESYDDLINRLLDQTQEAEA